MQCHSERGTPGRSIHEFRSVSQRQLLESGGQALSSARVGRIDPARRSPSVKQFVAVLSAWGLYPLPRTSSVPTPRDAHSVSHPVAAWGRGACIPFRGCRLYRPRGSLFQPLLKCVGPVLPPATVVCTDPAGRSLSFIFCRCLKCVGPVLPSAGVVCTDSAGRFFSLCLSAWRPLPPPASVVCAYLAGRSFSVHPVAA